jgi:hypothetical protein
MDPRLAPLLAQVQATGFADFAGSESYSVVRVHERLLNEAAAAFVASSTIVRTVTVHPRASNQIDVQLKLAKPAFLPAFNIGLHVDRQPQLPDDPVLVLRLTGAGGLLRLAAPALESSGALPPGIRIEGDRLLVDVRELLQREGRAELLRYAEQVHVLSEEGRLVIAAQLRVR